MVCKNLKTDHLGNTYPSFTAMCKPYKKDRSTVEKRLMKGMTLEEALTIRLEYTGKTHDHPCKDHLGHKFSSFKAMCIHWHQSDRTVHNRMDKLHMSLEEALTTPPNPAKKKKECVDFLGNHFPTLKEMCEHHHVDEQTYRNRIKAGKNNKEALTDPVYKKEAIVPNLKEFLAGYGNVVDPDTFYNRIDRGYSIENAALLPKMGTHYQIQHFLDCDISATCINPDGKSSTMYFNCQCETCAKQVNYDMNQIEKFRFVGTIDMMKAHNEHHQKERDIMLVEAERE